MAKRARAAKVCKRTCADVATFLEKQEAEEDENVSKIVSWLQKNPGKSKAVLLACEGGMFSGPVKAKEDNIPPSRTHLVLLSAKVLKEALAIMMPALGGAELAKVAKKKPAQLLQLFCFATGAAEEDPVFSHELAKFNKYYERCHTALGKRLQNVKIDEAGTVLWSECGYFSIESLEGEQVIKHVGGATVPVPSNYEDNNKWSFENNHSERKATLTDGENSINVYVRFTNHHVSLECDLVGLLAQLEPATVAVEEGESSACVAEPATAVEEAPVATPVKECKRSRLLTAGRAPAKPPAAA